MARESYARVLLQRKEQKQIKQQERKEQKTDSVWKAPYEKESETLGQRYR